MNNLTWAHYAGFVVLALVAPIAVLALTAVYVFIFQGRENSR